MKTILIIFLFTISLTAQERVLLHINKDGQQETIPLKKGQRAQDVIGRLEHSKASLTKSTSPAGLIDTLKYFTNDASLTTSFSYAHQDVALQWYVPQAGGRVKEFWWHNSTTTGYIHKATIRAWLVDPKVTSRPTSVITKYLGYYSDPTDGDGLKSPFKPATGNTWFYGNGGADSSIWRFDPTGTEVATWLPGSGLQVNLLAGIWQGIQLGNWGDSMHVDLGQPFGFTFSNDTKYCGDCTDTAMMILATPQSGGAPYHSYKYYENGRLVPGQDGGWWLRGDYDWGFYVVIEYTTDRPPKIVVNYYPTTLSTTPRPISATITDDNPSGGPAGVASAYLKFKKGSLTFYDSVAMIASGSTYKANIPGGTAIDTIYWYITAKDVNNNYSALSPRSYQIFHPGHQRLLIYNNSQYSIGNASLIYTGSDRNYDRWSIPNDGVTELADLLALYDKVLLADGSFPFRDVYTIIKNWLGTGTAAAKKNLFFTSQDYGCFISNACVDTVFDATTFENKYLGVTRIGPQDQGSTNRPVKMVPQSDTMTNYIIQYNTDSATTLWYYPQFELAFAAYPDYVTPTASAKALFRNSDGTGVYGVRNSGTGFNTMYCAFDAGALQFRGDTSLHSADYKNIMDPKYRWIVDVQSLANVFLNPCCYDPPPVGVENGKLPYAFSLNQNFPNPFNPITTINYEIPSREQVLIVIYNVLGQQVATVVNELKEPGVYTASFNAQSLASGLYFYEMRAGSYVSVKKMVLMK